MKRYKKVDIKSTLFYVNILVTSLIVPTRTNPNQIITIGITKTLPFSFLTFTLGCTGTACSCVSGKGIFVFRLFGTCGCSTLFIVLNVGCGLIVG